MLTLGSSSPTPRNGTTFLRSQTKTDKTLYRLLETLGENNAFIISGIQDRIFSRYQFEHTDVNLDWTSLVLHGSASPLEKYGYIRDNRPDKQLIT